MARLFSYKKKEGSENIKDKVTKTIDNLARLTGSLLGYDRSAFATRGTDVDFMTSIDLRLYIRDAKIVIDRW